MKREEIKERMEGLKETMNSMEETAKKYDEVGYPELASRIRNDANEYFKEYIKLEKKLNK